MELFFFFFLTFKDVEWNIVSAQNGTLSVAGIYLQDVSLALEGIKNSTAISNSSDLWQGSVSTKHQEWFFSFLFSLSLSLSLFFVDIFEISGTFGISPIGLQLNAYVEFDADQVTSIMANLVYTSQYVGILQEECRASGGINTILWPREDISVHVEYERFPNCENATSPISSLDDPTFMGARGVGNLTVMSIPQKTHNNPKKGRKKERTKE
jgi:hypothetical protein